MKAKTHLWYGWYSEKQRVFTGTVTYKRAGAHGMPVKITMITETGEHGASWDDVKFVGIVEGSPLGREESSHPFMRRLEALLDECADDAVRDRRCR
jgi:hypothetical protein